MKILKTRVLRLAWTLVLVAAAASPASGQQAESAAAAAGPLRQVWYPSFAPVQNRPPVTISPSLASAGASRASKVGQTVLLLGAGIGLTAGGRELQSSLGFPGAVIRYTGIGVNALGVLSFCGCL